MAEELEQQGNPFAEFGGSEIKSQGKSSNDPFADFGGKAIDVKKKSWFQQCCALFPYHISITITKRS
jgi:hypothetical protein